MIDWTKESLEEAGYRIENATIKKVDLSMADHGVLTLSMVLEGSGWGCVYGGYVLGQGYVGAKQFKGSAIGLESIMRIMDVIECDTFNQMNGKIIRVAVKGISTPIKIIGNVINEKWFDAESFYSQEDR